MAAAGAAVPEPALAPKKLLISAGISILTNSQIDVDGRVLVMLLLKEMAAVFNGKARGDAPVAQTRARRLSYLEPT